ncbi:MAG: hypothetical protein JWQ98_2080 [Chlorobi bacterium]|nr:hypothetical protein [Chlorobiota bacterium]
MSNRSKAVAGLGLIFLLGGFCGALVYGIIVRDNLRERQQLRTHEGFVQYFVYRLQLTEAQRDSLRGELDRVYDQLSDLRSATSSQYEAVIDTFTQRIGPRLTESQRALLREQEQKLRGMVPHEKRRTAENERPMPPPSAQVAPTTTKPVETRRPESLSVAAGNGKATPAPNVIVQPPLAATSGSGGDNEGDSGLGKLAGRMQELRARLNLTDDQAKQIQTIFSDNKAKNATVRSQFSTQPLVLRTSVMQNNREARRKIKALLSDTQLAALKKLQQERHDQAAPAKK